MPQGHTPLIEIQSDVGLGTCFYKGMFHNSVSLYRYGRVCFKDGMTQTPSNLGSTLKTLLIERGLSAAELARQSELSIASLSRILNNQTNPGFETVVKLAQVLGVSLDVLGGQPSRPGSQTIQPDVLLQAVFVLENTGHSADAVGELLLKATTSRWNHSWTDDYTPADLPKPEVVQALQVGTGRMQVTVAWPHTYVERGSIAGILSVVGSTLTGTGAKLLDIEVPQALIRTFAGPAFGVRGLADTFNKHGRPLLSCTIRPMVGLSGRQYGRAAFEALSGGADLTADPTLLHSVPGALWRERFRFAAEAAHAAMQATNEFKTHAVNISAATVEDMIERALWAKDLEMACVMVDSAAVGWSAIQSLAGWCARNDMLLATMGGRALAGDMLSEALQAKLLRLAGADIVSTGSPLRGNVSNRRSVGGVLSTLRDDFTPHAPDAGHHLAQPYSGLNSSLPAVGGGHNPWHFPRLIDAVGDASILQCGGAMMGHPGGGKAGATATRVAVEAVVQARNEGQNLSVEGRSILQRAARYSPELKTALDHWQEGSFLFGVVPGAGSHPTHGTVIPHGTNPSPSITPFRKPGETDGSDDDKGDK